MVTEVSKCCWGEKVLGRIESKGDCAGGSAGILVSVSSRFKVAHVEQVGAVVRARCHVGGSWNAEGGNTGKIRDASQYILLFAKPRSAPRCAPNSIPFFRAPPKGGCIADLAG